MHRILVIDDDGDLRFELADALEDAGGFETQVVRFIRDGERLLTLPNARISAILLDVSLPDGDGRQFCARLREQGRTLPIILMSGLRAEQDAVEGLTLGADDYVRKPFSTPELIARLRGLLRPG